MKRSVYIAGLILAATGASGFLTGCSVESESWMNGQRVEIHEDQFSDTFETSKLDDEMLRAVAVYHQRYGNGPLVASVSYDPKSNKNNRLKAERESKRIAGILNRNGVDNIQIGTTAAAGSGDVSTTVVTFAAMTAQAPAGCGMMPGYYGPNDIQSKASGQPDYRFGCSVETLIARQVTRPSDLLGKNGFETDADGRRQANVVGNRGYYGDKSNPDLGGEQASDD